MIQYIVFTLIIKKDGRIYPGGKIRVLGILFFLMI